MTDSTERRFSKRVQIAEKDADERTVTGVALVPWEVDRQDDWLTPDGVQAMHNPAPDDGVMHAVFPETDAETVESYVTDEPIELGGDEYPAGTWVIKRQYLDDDLWQLVNEDILAAFSIGGTVTRDQEFDNPEDLPEEVAFPNGVEEGSTTQILNGATDEVSDVDIPAVPRAVHTAKEIGKTLYDESTDQEEFVETMEDRGHTAEEAELLFEYLETAAKVSPAAAAEKFASTNGDPEQRMGDQTPPDDAALDKQDVGFLKWLRQKVGGPSDDPVADIDKAALSPAAVTKGVVLLKEGRTLSETNRERMMAAHDAIETALASEMDFSTNRFTNNDAYDFDLTEYEDKTAADEESTAEKLTVEQGENVVEAIEEFLETQGNATYAEFREWAWHMWDEWDGDKAFAVDHALDQYREWYQDLHDEQPVTDEFGPWIESESDIETEITMEHDEHEKRIEELESEVSELKTELDDKQTDKGDSTGDADDGDSVDKDARIEELKERVDKLSKRTAGTDQIGNSDEAEGDQKSAVEVEKEVFTR